jgi:hypothetical protein
MILNGSERKKKVFEKKWYCKNIFVVVVNCNFLSEFSRLQTL